MASMKNHQGLNFGGGTSRPEFRRIGPKMAKKWPPLKRGSKMGKNLQTLY